MSFLNECRHAVRRLRKSGAFSTVAVLVLALGIGVNVGVCCVVYEVLLRPLSYDRPEAITRIDVPDPDSPGSLVYGLSWPHLQDWRTTNKSFDLLAGFEGSAPQNLQVGSEVYGVFNVSGTADLLSIFGVPAKLGRIIQPGEDENDSVGPIVLSEQVWTTVFARDPQILGRSVRVQGKPYKIIGVMPASFSFPVGQAAQVWTVTAMDQAIRSDRTLQVFKPIGRLKGNVPLRKAQSDLSTIQAAIAAAYPDLHLGNRVVMQTYRSEISSKYRFGLLALQGSVLIVWLIACVNVTGLFLSRNAARWREISIRKALGARRSHLILQFLAEALILSLCGSLIGLVFAVGVLHQMQPEIAKLLYPFRDFQVNPAVMGVLLLLSVVAALIIAVLPGLQLAKSSDLELVRGQTPGPRKPSRLASPRDTIVVVEIALTTVLLVAAGLLQRTLYSLDHVPLGFSKENVVTGSLIFPQGLYEKSDINTAVFAPLLERARALPGISNVAISSVLPMRSEFSATATFRILDGDQPNGGAANAQLRVATPGLPAVLDSRILEGRFCQDQDTRDSTPVAVVNRSFVQHYFQAHDAVGRTLAIAQKGKFSSVPIVGVLDNMKQTNLTKPSVPEMYLCAAQVVPGTPFYDTTSTLTQLAFRTRNDPRLSIPAIRRMLAGIAPEARIGDLKTLEQIVNDSMGLQRLAAMLLGLLAAVALSIALAGMYGSLHHSVRLRTQEIGVRMALGARRGVIFSSILGRTGILLGVGLLLGICVSWMVGRILSSFLFGVKPHDPATMVSIAALFVLCAFLASSLPAWHAASIDPIKSLRSE